MNIFEAADYGAILIYAVPFGVVVGGWLGWQMFGGNENPDSVYMKHYNLENEDED